VTVARITPPVVHLRLEPVIKLTLPVSVRPSASRRWATAYRKPQCSPPALPCGASRRCAPPHRGRNRAGGSQRNPRRFQRLVRLATEGKRDFLARSGGRVSVAIKEEASSRDFAQAEIGVQDFKGIYTVNPKLFFACSGPKSLVDKLQLSPTNVFVTLQGLSAGDHNLAPQFDLPNGLKVVEHKPARVRVKIAKPAAESRLERDHDESP
jgi:hypothetical protein